MNLANWLEQTARLDPSRPALFLGRDLVADYGAFRDRAARLGAALIAQGVHPGDRVAIFMKNTPDYLLVEYGAWFAGAAVVPINAKLHWREAAWIIENAGAGLVFATSDQAKGLTEADLDCVLVNTATDDFETYFSADPMARPVARSPDDLAWLFYTSGTTGKPKGVIMTHGMLSAMSLAYFVDAEPVRGQDAALYAAPLSHGAGIYNMMHVLKGARHVFPRSGGFDEQEIFDLAAHFGSVQMFAAPTMVKRMTEVARANGQSGEGLRSVVYAGGPMYHADIIEAVDCFGPIFIQIYGQGECPMSITALSRHDVADREHPRWRARLGSVGRAQSVVEVRIADTGGKTLPEGEVGEIMVRGQTVMPGYWRNVDATQKALQNGWLLTGDMGFMDADGYVTLQDRSKDMIISGGSNIYPREVEEILLTLAGVSEVGVVGRASAEWGEDVVAFVVKAPQSEITTQALDDHCLANIARFKRPKAYYFVPELPKNNYGKVLKTKLRDWLETKIPGED